MKSIGSFHLGGAFFASVAPFASALSASSSMAAFYSRLHLRHTELLAVVIAVAVASLAALLRLLLEPWLGDHLPLFTLYGAVSLVLWWVGYRAALLCAALGYLICNYFFVTPRGELAISEPRDVIGLIAYAVSIGTVIFFGEGMRRAEIKARRRQEELIEADQRKDNFLATLAHELRNPLAPIRNIAKYCA
jgi:K+-sensing histidine kinase KdpD